MEKIIGTVPGKCRKKREKARLTLNNNPEISWHMKKSRRTYNGVHLNKKSNTQDVVEQSLTENTIRRVIFKVKNDSSYCGNYFRRDYINGKLQDSSSRLEALSDSPMVDSVDIHPFSSRFQLSILATTSGFR